MLLNKEESLLSKGLVKPSNDVDRYIKMALRIDPKNPEILIRNTNDLASVFINFANDFSRTLNYL